MFYDGKDSDSEWNGGQVISKSYGVTKQLVEIVYFQLHKPFSLFPCVYQADIVQALDIYLYGSPAIIMRLWVLQTNIFLNVSRRWSFW